MEYLRSIIKSLPFAISLSVLKHPQSQQIILQVHRLCKPSSKSIISKPRRPSDPSNAAGARRASVVWFRNDLRVHDNESVSSANNESMSVLPVCCFDPRDYGKSSSGFDKTGWYCASFLIESVSNLRKNLQARGSELIVRIGKPKRF
ncbi:hypothetical protein L1887_03309 [Cichorium endivia]|nr:hypothetical protein L1887_03309 [Cichorium endivia]